MTREKQILEYANSFKGKGMESDELKEIIRLAIIDGAKWADSHPIKSSLPSNLDEAASAYENELWEFGYKECGYSPQNIADAFKAGAEWMAEQGITLEGRASRKYENGLAGFVSWVLFDQQKAAHLLVNQGEEADVILQIRKKQL